MPAAHTQKYTWKLINSNTPLLWWIFFLCIVNSCHILVWMSILMLISPVTTNTLRFRNRLLEIWIKSKYFLQSADTKLVNLKYRSRHNNFITTDIPRQNCQTKSNLPTFIIIVLEVFGCNSMWKASVTEKHRFLLVSLVKAYLSDLLTSFTLNALVHMSLNRSISNRCGHLLWVRPQCWKQHVTVYLHDPLCYFSQMDNVSTRCAWYFTSLRIVNVCVSVTKV